LSAIPAQAVVNELTITVGNGTATTTVNDSLTAATVNVDMLSKNLGDTVAVKSELVTSPGGSSTAVMRLQFKDTANVSASATTYKNSVASSAGGAAIASGLYIGDGSSFVISRIDTPGAQGSFATGDTSSSARMGANFLTYVDSTSGTVVAGTYTFKITATPYHTGVAQTAVTATGTIVVSAAASASLVADPTNSTAVMYQGSAFVAGNTVDSVVAVAATASNTARAIIRVVLKNAAGTANSAMESITATIDKGTIGDGTTQGRSVVLAYSSNSLDLQVKSDGTAGQATVTIKSTSVTFANKVLTFYSTTVSTMTATQLAKTLKVGTNSSAIGVVAKDANGNVVGSSTAVYAYSSATGVVSETATACTYSATYNQHFCDLTGVTAGTATVSFGTSGKTVVTPDFTVRVVGNTASTVSIAFDKATYQPGEAGYIIVSAKNADGYYVAGALSNLLATGGITSNVALTSAGSGISTSDSMTTGTVSPTLAFSSTGYVSQEPVYAIKFFAPQTSGAITLTATGGAGLPLASQVKVTATANVVNSAQVSADAALAAVTALATQVSAFITKINAQITTLTDLVMKIQKKVKA